LAPDAQRIMAERRAMLQHPYVLDEADRAVVLEAIRRHCVYRGWNLLAAHVSWRDAGNRSLAVAARYQAFACLHIYVAHPIEPRR
jgi:hypothetical protein